ncbi:MAG: aminotransferase class V-fold PLP-dependent enzyme, partial [Acidimicrobiales bacterium]
EAPRIAALRERLGARLADTIPGLARTTTAPTAPGHLHLLINGVESESLLVLLDRAGVCASAGSACASGAMHASPVLLAMGVPEPVALGSLRLTLGHTTTTEEVDLAAKAIAEVVAGLRAGDPRARR